MRGQCPKDSPEDSKTLSFSFRLALPPSPSFPLSNMLFDSLSSCTMLSVCHVPSLPPQDFLMFFLFLALPWSLFLFLLLVSPSQEEDSRTGPLCDARVCVCVYRVCVPYGCVCVFSREERRLATEGQRELGSIPVLLGQVTLILWVCRLIGMNSRYL